MKKNILILTLSVLVLVFAACDQPAKPKPKSPITWEEASYTHQLDENESTGIALSVNIKIPAVSKDAAYNSIRSQLIDILFAFSITEGISATDIDYRDANKAVTQWAVAQQKNFQEMLAGEDLGSGLGLWLWSMDFNIVPIIETEKFVTFQIDASNYIGGAHGNYGTSYYTFEIESGRMVHDNALWKEGSEEVLHELLVGSLKRYLERAPYSDIELFWLDEVKTNDNFRLTPDSIYYMYNVYEIAPYCEGPHTFGLSAEEAMPYLNPDGIAYHYWESKTTTI